jgi:hypothetical protein
MSVQLQWVLSVIVAAVLLVGGMEWIKRLVRQEVERAWERRFGPAYARLQLQAGEESGTTDEEGNLSDAGVDAVASSEAKAESQPSGEAEASSTVDAEGTPPGKWESENALRLFEKINAPQPAGDPRPRPACYPKLWKALKSAQTQIWALYEPPSERSGEIDIAGWKGIKGIPVWSRGKRDAAADDEEPFEKLRGALWRLRRSLAHSAWRRVRDLLIAHELDCSEEVFREASQVVRDLRRVLAMATEDADAPGPRLLRNEVYGKLLALKRRLQTELGRTLHDGPESDGPLDWWNPGR